MIELTMIKLMNLLVTLDQKERETILNHEDFKSIRDCMKKDGDFINLEDEKALRKQLVSIINIASDYWLDHLVNVPYVNKGISNYVVRSLSDVRINDPIRIASAICALGNADTHYDNDKGVICLIEHINNLKCIYTEAVVGEDKETYATLNKFAEGIYHAGILAQAICTFMVAKYGSCKGVGEHFGQNVEEVSTNISDTPESVTDTFTGDITPAPIDGLETYPILLEGLEQFINADSYTPTANQTYQQRYVIGVMISQGIMPTMTDGMEGAIWDKVKVGFTKAYQMIKDGLAAIKENFFDKSLEEMQTDTQAVADANKKALQAVTEKDAVMPDNVKTSLNNLADATNNDDIKTAVSGLNDVSAASGVIDKLLTVFTSVYNETATLKKEFDEIDSGIKELESQSNNAPDDTDKDALAVKKAAISEKTKEMKDKFTELKSKLAAQRAQLNAITKAIKGITPAIFVKAKEAKE